MPLAGGRPGVGSTTAGARRQCGEDRVELFHDFRLAADHHAVTAFQSPHAAARPDVDEWSFLGREFVMRRMSST